MNTNFFVAEDEAFNPNKVLTRKEMDAFIGDRGIKSYAGVLKKDNKLFYNFIRVKVAEGKNCVDAIYARKAIVSNGCLRNDFFSFGEYNFVAFVTNGKIYCDLKNFFNERFGIESMCLTTFPLRQILSLPAMPLYCFSPIRVSGRKSM